MHCMVDFALKRLALVNTKPRMPTLVQADHFVGIRVVILFDRRRVVRFHRDEIRMIVQPCEHNRHESTVENFEIGIDRCIVWCVDFPQPSIPNGIASFKRPSSLRSVGLFSSVCHSGSTISTKDNFFQCGKYRLFKEELTQFRINTQFKPEVLDAGIAFHE